MKKLCIVILGLCMVNALYTNDITTAISKKKSKEVIYLDAAKGLLFTFLGISHMHSSISSHIHFSRLGEPKKYTFAFVEGSTLFALTIYGMKLINNARADLAQITE